MSRISFTAKVKGGGGVSVTGPWDQILKASRFGLSYTASVCGDSTSDNLAAIEWPQILLKLLSEKYPKNRYEHYQWADGSQTYGAATVISAGAAATGGVITHDTFSVAGSATGAAADTKGTWVGNGTVTKAGGTATLGTSTASISALTPTQDSTVTTKMQVTTAGSNVFNAFRFGNANSASHLAGFGVFMTLSLNSTFVTHLTKTKHVAAGAQTISSETLDLGLANVTAKNVTVETSLIGLTFTATITVEGRAPVVRSFDITAQEKSEIGSYAGVSNNPGNGFAGIAFDEVKLETAVIPTPTIKIYNGSVAGKNPDYLRAAGRLAAIMPVKMDAVFFSYGHNSHLNPGSPTDFITDYKVTLDQVRAAQADATFYIGSQNPEFTPRDASLVATHAIKQSLLERMALDVGARYVPVFEGFVNSAVDNGQTLVQGDGVHPSNPATLVTNTNVGSTVWAKIILGLVS